MVRFLLALILAFLPATGARAMTLPTIGVTIDGGTVTSQLMSAQWNLGIADFLSDLAPNTASLTFKGQLSVSPADAVVISAGGTAMWTGRLDTYVETRDVNGDYWSSVTATDLIGALGSARLRNIAPGYPVVLDAQAEARAAAAGITIDIVDSSSAGLVSLNGPSTYDGQLLEYINVMAVASNAMLALQHDGTIKAWTREALYAPDVSNGTFDVNTTGWSATGTGASISRVTASPFAGAGNLRVVSGTDAFGGTTSTVTGTFKKDHTYRLTFYGRTISGPATVAAQFGSSGVDESFPTKTLTASWVAYTVDWTPTADRSNPTVKFLNPNSTTTRTFEVDSVGITEVVNATDISASIVTWEKTTSVDVDINRWLGFISGGGGGTSVDQSDAADIAIYGERTFDGAPDSWETTPDCPLVDWYTYGGSQRSIVTRGELVVSDSASSLLALDPLDWVNDGTDDWQIMSMSWSAAPGEPWRLTITADNLIALL